MFSAGRCEDMEYGYYFYVILGWISGSILFGRLVPMFLKGVDVEEASGDGNPGTFNAFACGGALCGVLVLICDLAKGALPVMLCSRRLGTEAWPFALVMAAPVFGHAHSVFQKGHGGKAIAVSFGVLIGLLPIWKPLVFLIFWYLLFVAVIPVKSNTRKSIYAFLGFSATSFCFLRHKVILAGGLLLSGIVIHKHCLKANAAYREGGEWRLE